MTNQPPIERPWDPPKPPKQSMSKQTKWIVVGVIGAFVLFVVGRMVFVSLTNGNETPVAAATAESSLSVTEQDFVRVLGMKPSGFTQEQMISEGRQVCDIFEAGGVGTNAVSRLIDLGVTPDDAVRVVFAATVSFCPEYELDAQR